MLNIINSLFLIIIIILLIILIIKIKEVKNTVYNIINSNTDNTDNTGADYNTLKVFKSYLDNFTHDVHLLSSQEVEDDANSTKYKEDIFCRYYGDFGRKYNQLISYGGWYKCMIAFKLDNFVDRIYIIKYKDPSCKDDDDVFNKTEVYINGHFISKYDKKRQSLIEALGKVYYRLKGDMFNSQVYNFIFLDKI